MDFISRASDSFYIIVNENKDILEVLGQPGDVIKIPLGKVSPNLYSLLDESIVFDVRSLLDHAIHQKKYFHSDLLPYNSNGEQKYIQFRITPFRNEKKIQNYSIQFCFFSTTDLGRIYEFKNQIHYDAESKLEIELLKSELTKTKNSLASYIEQLEETNKTIVRTNEDLNYASNRYQSLNEQLEASNEELRVSNEELQNAYAEVSMLNNQLKENQRELERKEATLRAMVDNVPGVIFSAIYSKDENFQFTYLSPKIEPLFGIDIHTAYEKGRHALPIHPDDLKDWKDSILYSVETLFPWSQQGRFLFPNGKVVYWEAHATITRRDDGAAIFDGVLLNVTKQKEQEQVANRLREDFRNTVTNVIAVVYKLKRLENGEYVYVFNDGFIGDTLGITTDKVAGKSLKEICGESEAIKLRKEYDQAFFGGPVETEFTFRDRWYFSRIVPYSEDGKPVGIMGSAIDITEKKHLESRFLQSQKMETIGYLAGGIAHDLNNMLQPIFIYSNLLKDEWEIQKESKSLEKLEKILASVERAKKLVGQVLDFSRNNTESQENKEFIPLKKSIEENLNLLLLDMPCHIKQNINLKINPNTYIHMDPVKFTQVLMNLINNAIHSMHDKKESNLYINSYAVDRLPDDWKSDIKIEDCSGCILEIIDTGIGIDSGKIERIFDPFFTDKAVGEGLGLGLSIVHGIIQKSGGSIDVSSKLNQGTVFRVFLPTTHKDKSIPKEDEIISLSKGTIPYKGEVLLVDDDEFTKESIQDLLEMKSIPYQSFAEGALAIEHFQRNSTQISLIITDYKMPKMSGTEFVQKIRSLDQSVPIILYSGNTLPITEEFLRTNRVTLLEKPLDVGVLLKNIETLRKK